MAAWSEAAGWKVSPQLCCPQRGQCGGCCSVGGSAPASGLGASPVCPWVYVAAEPVAWPNRSRLIKAAPSHAINGNALKLKLGHAQPGRPRLWRAASVSEVVVLASPTILGWPVDSGCATRSVELCTSELSMLRQRLILSAVMDFQVGCLLGSRGAVRQRLLLRRQSARIELTNAMGDTATLSNDQT